MNDLQATRLLAQLHALLQLEMSSMSFDMLCELDQSFAKLSVKIKRSRNLAVPINRLPLEILQTILELVVNPPTLFSAPLSSRISIRYPHVKVLKNLSGVCNWWSNVVRQNPAFYCDIIELETRSWRHAKLSVHSRLFLTRSGAARPLRLLATFPPTLDSTTADVLNNNMHRLRELHINSREYFDFPGLTKTFLAQSAPILQCFTGRFEHGIYSDTPLQLFGHCSPCLEALALIAYESGMLPLQTFPNLAHIYLSGLECEPPELGDFLRNSPKLETIYLEDFSFEPGLDALARPYPLPRLRAFVCDKTSIWSIMYILADIIMPLGIRVIRLTTDYFEEFQMAPPHPQFSLVRTLQAIGPFEELAITEEDNEISVRATGHSCRFSLRCKCEAGVDVTSWLDPAWSALPFAHVITMRADMTDRTTKILDLFSRTPSLHKLVLRVPDSFANRFAWNSTLSSWGTLEYTHEGLMPDLEEIDLQFDIQFWVIPHITKILSLFAAVARSRRDATAARALRVFRVNMRELDPKSSELKPLRETVGEVEVTKRNLWPHAEDGDESGGLWKVRNEWWELCPH